MTGPPDVYDVLVVGWLPAVDDLIAGRFVADQVEAVRATGRIRPAVVSFENAALRGSAALRVRQETAVREASAAAIGARDPFNQAGAGGPTGIPVARLTVAAGSTPSTGLDHRASHRVSALLPLAERPDRPDWRLVHAHVGYPDAAAAAVLATRLGVPLVVTEHATFVESFLAEPAVKARYVETAVGAARMIAVSRMLASELEAAIPALAGRLSVIPNAVAIDDFTPIGAAGRRPAELLWVGYRKEIKGIADMLRAFRLVLDARPEATLRLIGRSVTEDDERGWRRLAAELGIAGSVRFEPPADRAGVATAMSQAACFVHASTRETFGVVAVEALAAGLPVVATDSGGVAEVLGPDPNRFGALVHASDPAALAAAVIRTLDRRSAFDPLELHAYAAQQFGSAAVGRRLVALYDEVLTESGQGTTVPKHPKRPAAPTLLPAGKIIVVGFVRAELDRVLERFPEWVFAEARIVTSGRSLARAGITLAPAGTAERLAEVLEWGAPSAARPRRLVRRLRRWSRRLRARFGRGEGSDGLLVDQLTRTVERAVTAQGSERAPVLVCISGIDYLAAMPLFADRRAEPAPGGLRWLADRRVADLRDQEAEGAASSEA
jgi:glycosyltransferase involved in cell wall biosynthesis